MLTPHFLRHLFQETLTFKSRDPTAVTSDGDVVLEMDFRGFLDFAMAMHSSNEIASLKYYWYVVPRVVVFSFAEVVAPLRCFFALVQSHHVTLS